MVFSCVKSMTWYVDIVGVTGSIPVAPTILKNAEAYGASRLCAPIVPYSADSVRSCVAFFPQALRNPAAIFVWSLKPLLRGRNIVQRAWRWGSVPRPRGCPNADDFAKLRAWDAGPTLKRRKSSRGFSSSVSATSFNCTLLPPSLFRLRVGPCRVNNEAFVVAVKKWIGLL